MPVYTLDIPHGSEVSRRILGELRQRVRMSTKDLGCKYEKWRQAEEETVAYVPEREVDAARRLKREGGLPQYTTIKVPYSYAVLMSAHTYMTSVFLSRNPVMQFSGRHGETEQQVQGVEALLDYQVTVGNWMVPLFTWLYDVGKYGVGITGLYWEERKEHVSQITFEDELNILQQPTGKKIKKQTTVEVMGYQGNCVYNIQPWDFIWDTRWALRDYQKGEFAALRVSLGWNEIVRRKAEGYYMNVDKIDVKHAYMDIGTYGADSGVLNKPASNSSDHYAWDDWESPGKKRPAMVKAYEVYIELIPKEWGLGSTEYPQKWVFTCTADFSVLLGAGPLGALHAKFPVNVLTLDCEAYGLVTRGLPEILEPIQQTVDWLLNSHFYNVRAALNNRYVVDPSRVVMKDVLDPAPGGVIRMKPSAYGQDARTAVAQMQTQDVTRMNINDLQMMFGLGERTVGINDQIMGMMNGGGRKTATEIRTSTTFGVNRLKTIVEWCSAMGFAPFSQMAVQNTQQFYDAQMKFKIAGDLSIGAGAKFMMVDAQSIAGAYDFVPVDGSLPVDRFAQANLWKELMAGAQRMPQLMMGYDWVRVFDWVAQLAGLKNITQFKVQVGSPQQLSAQAQAGNLIPMPSAGGRANMNEPKQIPGMGATG